MVPRDFYDLRDELVASNQKFDPASLRLVPYNQLALACIGSAGEAACSPQSVCAEKAGRREQFLSLSAEDFKASEIFLQVEGMYEDVTNAVAARAAPRWEDLKNRQQAWAKLICIYNHLDDVVLRMNEAVLLLRSASVTTLPPEPTSKWVRKLKGLLTVYPERVSESLFRESVAEIAESLLDFLPDEERKTCEREEIRNFSCTSDCFRVLTN